MGSVHGIYYKTADNKIYKYNSENDYFLLCTPWKTGEDRRKKRTELNNPVKINKHVAVHEINEIWRNTKFSWVHAGKKYETRGTIYDDKTLDTHTWEFNGKSHTYNTVSYNNLFKLCQPHIFKHTYKNKNNVEQSYEYTYYLVCYQGKLVWVQNTQYIPQVCYYKFEAIDKEPRYTSYTGWTNINCIKPVFCITDKKYI